MLENAGKRLCRSWRESSAFAGVQRAVAVAAVALAAFGLTAAPVPLERVQRLAQGVAASVQFSFSSGASVSDAQAVLPAQATVTAVAPTNSDEAAFYVVDRGAVGGFVVMSADDRLDPVLVIAPTGKFDTKPGTPLYDMLCRDVGSRLDVAQAEGAAQSEGWRALLDESDPVATSVAYASASSVDDVRVAPLVQSKWSQSIVYDDNWDEFNVYNYYTPNNYVCGCVATAGAQIMRHHEYPKTSVTPVTRTCYVDGAARAKTMKGGVYDWANMPLDPSHTVMTATACEAIGKLCYDMGVAIYMSWTSAASGTSAHCLQEAFTQVFGYANAMAWYQDKGTLPDKIIQNALLANFDAGYPVEISIQGPSSAHSIVADGYGYQSGSLYVHLNFGWGGSEDAWYHLPDIGTSRSYNLIDGAVYNIFPNGTGDLLTGRVVDSATRKPIVGATVQVLDGSTVVGATTTSAAGIYALRLRGGKTYSVVASAAGAVPSDGVSVYLPKSETIKTETRYYYLGTGSVGNSWGNDIRLTTAVGPSVPTAPTGVSAADGTSTAKIRVTWNAVAGAEEYEVYRAESDSQAAADLLASGVRSAYYDDKLVEVGITYYYWVVACNSSGKSEFSESDSGWLAYAVPDAPTGVSASDGTSTSGVTVTWEGVSSAASYSVWRSEEPSTATAVALTSGRTSLTYTDTSAVPGITYYYWVKATNQGGTSAFSAYDSGYRAIAAPAAPTGVSASDGLSSTEIVVTWNAVEGATSYSVWRATSSTSVAATQVASGLTITTYVDTSAVSGTTYTYWVKATNVGGTSGFGASDTGYLAAIKGPTTVSASDGTYSGYVRVSWAASQDATKYEVWRGTVSAYSLASRIATPTGTAYDDASAVPGMRYYYWVKAVTAAGTSAFSASDTGYRPLAAPTGVTASTGRSTGVLVSWPAVTGALTYEVGRGAKGASRPAVTFEPVTGLTYNDDSAVPGVTYAYFVRAVASACNSAWSAVAQGSRSIPTPVIGEASDGAYSDRILVKWPALAGAKSYELMRASENDIALAETVVTTNGTEYSDMTVEYGLPYYYFLRATFDAGTSPWSASEVGWRAFPVPTGVSATDGSSTANITVTWDAIAGAAQFQVWRRRTGVAEGRDELIGTSTTTSYKDSKNIEPGIQYAYRVKAVYPTGTSRLSEADTGYLKAASPVVSATDGTSTSQITLTWNATPGAVAYLVCRSKTSSPSDITEIGSTTNSSFSTSDLFYEDVVNPLNANAPRRGTLYYYWVRTATAIDVSDFGASDTGYVGLDEVSRVTASEGEYADKVVVRWNAVDGAQTYEVWRGDSEDPSRATRVVKGVGGLMWEDTGVTPGQRFWYWVRACDVGPGLWGQSDSGYRTLSAPPDVTATTNQTDGVKVSWKGTTSGVSFEIMRGFSDDPSSADVIATVADKATYTDTTAVPGYVYYYWVRAYSDLSESGWSSSVSGIRAVSAPMTVAATDGTSLDSVTVTWTAATSAKRYEIWRNTTTKTDTAELLGTTNKLVWVDTGVEQGVAYYYWIRSVSALDTSAFSNRDVGYASTPAPTDVAASDGTSPTSVRVTWVLSEGALNYAVWRAESEDASKATQLKTGLTETSYEDTTVTPGKFYWYWVRPVSTPGPGVFAGPDSGFAVLAAPTDVVASSDNEQKVTVSWKKSNGAVSYEIFRAEKDDFTVATNVMLASVTTTTYGDTNTVPAVKYWYWVRARAEACVSPLGGPGEGFRTMSVPTGVAATDGTSTDYVKITWKETLGATEYEVWRAKNSTKTTEADFIGGVSMLEFIDTTAEQGVSYTYWVKAASVVYTSGFSAYDKGWRSAYAPTGVSASDGTTVEGVVVTWNSAQGAVKYEVWRNSGDEANTNGAARVFTTADGSTCSYTDTSAKVDVRYWYWVRTVSSAGTGVFSESDDGYRAMPTPTNVKAADGASYDYVRVTWGAVTGAKSYDVSRIAKNDLTMSVTNVFNVTGTTFDDTNAVPGKIYNYWVRSVSSLCASDFVGPDDGYRKLQKINDVAASDGTSLDAVELTWTWPDGAEQCHVWRSTGTGVSSAEKIGTVSNGLFYADTTARYGVKYYYWVNGEADVVGEMGTSNDGWRDLLAPTDIQATKGVSTTEVQIRWSASPDATKYQIWRGTSPEPSEMVSVKEVSATTELKWEDTQGTAGELYYYSVRAGGTGGWGQFGTPDTGYKSLQPPTGVTAEDGRQDDRVKVQWNSVTGASHYRVYRRTDSESGEYIPVSKWQAETSFTDLTCEGTTKYYYYVKAAVDEQGTRASVFSGGDSGYARVGGHAILPVDFGGGITWPVYGNGDGTTTTNAIAISALEGGRLRFHGVQGEVGAMTTVQAWVKTALDSAETYTVEAGLKIVEPEMAELDLSSVWGTQPSLFVLGIATEKGKPLP